MQEAVYASDHIKKKQKIKYNIIKIAPRRRLSSVSTILEDTGECRKPQPMLQITYI